VLLPNILTLEETNAKPLSTPLHVNQVKMVGMGMCEQYPFYPWQFDIKINHLAKGIRPEIDKRIIID